MELKPMYPAQKDSPSTFLLGDISAVDVLLVVGNAAIIPQTVPFPLTIGINRTITETVMVTTINLENNQLTVTRGNPAYDWPAGTTCARVFTAKNLNDLQDNVGDIGENLTTVQETVATHNTDISALKTTVGGADSGLVKGLADEIVRAEAAEGAEVTRATGVEADLNTAKINRTELAQVITDWVYSADGTKVLVTITRYNASTQQTTEYTRTIPVVSNATMGVMTPEAYNEIASLRNDVNALINLGGRFIGVSFATKVALNEYVVPASVKTGDFTYVIDDETKDGATTRYVRNDSVWDFTFVIDYDPVGIADTETLGLVKSSKVIENWTLRSSAADNQWQSVCYGNGLFVAVAKSGTSNRVMTSPDGITWTLRSSAADNTWRSVCYGNGLFVAVATSGTGNRVMTSPDGRTWTLRSSAEDNNSWYSVCYGNGLFVAVAASGTGNRVMTSPDGITWTSRSSAADNNWYSVCYGNGLFVAVANSGTGNRVMTSPDGITWTSRSSAADIGWYFVCYGNGLFVAVAASGTGNRVMTSPDGITWTSRSSAADNNWYSVCYANGLFVAVAISGTGNRVMTSPDGITWTSRSSAADNGWSSVCYSNGLFVAVAYSGTGNRVMTSPAPSTGKNYVEIDGTMSVLGWDDIQSRMIDVEKDIPTRVPTIRTINSKALSADITLNASDVGATSSEVTATLTTSWSGSGPYTQTVTITGLGANQNGTVGIAKTATAAQRAAARDAQLMVTSQITNSITITADGDMPTIAIPIVVILMP